MSLLEKINKPNDIKKIDPSDYGELAKEIREFLVKKVSATGGHLASNLGVVELTMALHLFLDLPKDKLIWDVGHQAYTHKLLTGRKNEFDSLRQYEGLSGFPKTEESPCDAFNTGHSSTSISVADGIAKARDLKGEDFKVVAVIGDGALSGGLAYEALNNAGSFKSNMIIVLNDNRMSISENVGAMAAYLGKIRTNSKYTGIKMKLEDRLNKVPAIGPSVIKSLKTSKDSIKRLFVPGMFFENMGITYIGPVDGHNIPIVMKALNAAAQSKNPVLVHVITKKGKGYRPAEQDPLKFHGVGPFNKRTGLSFIDKNFRTYTEVFGSKIIDLARNNDKIVAISAAMAEGTGLTRFSKLFPSRFFDVGIAEEHAVTFAAGLASAGLHPVVAIYSTFLQRSYDQIVHDVALSQLPVTFCIDRAGIVGNDGETHQGIFDLSYLSHVPGLYLMAPKNAAELEQMMEFALNCNAPTAIRYPRGKATEKLSEFNTPIVAGKAEVLVDSDDYVVFAVGRMVKVMYEISQKLEESGIKLGVVNVRFVSPMDKEMVDRYASKAKLIFSCEENVIRGGFGESLGSYLMESGYKGGYINLALPDDYIVQGTPNELRDSLGFDPESLFKKIKDTVFSKRS
ncbi:MAG: 1-deoxy-D-xylulose-5-phosphate synthase [Lachnospiraceae bacterium]|nr:1-deoxy-D-xylulose-5-phosphate synthase [Lachnospiraceae bacterium]